MKNILNKAFLGQTLEERDIEYVLDLINNDSIIPEQIAALLGALASRGAKASEISAFAKYMKQTSIDPKLQGENFIDVCGTGGDCLGTFNISTAVSFIVASFGLKVIKHGARSVSSKCGSADVLEELGVRIDFPKEKLQQVLDYTNMVFLYAPDYNPLMAKIKKIRSAIGAPTIFNMLGPLINPVNLDFQVMGIYDNKKAEIIADTLNQIGLKSAMVVCSKDGLDELSITDENIAYFLNQGNIRKIEVPKPEMLNLKRAKVEDLSGQDKSYNAKIILKILNGEKNQEITPKRDIVLLNAAAALVVSNIAKDFEEGVKKAKEALDEGRALEILERLKDVS